MQLDHSFSVPVGVEEAWAVLLDIERIAPCLPGAAIDSVDGDDFTGTVKVKLGPIGLTYKGKASFVEKDEVAHRAVIDARGRDARGNGTAAAKVTATLTGSDTGTDVSVRTDLDITGKPAQFGRGVMADVGNKLIGQFAACLATKLAGTDEPAPPPDAAEQPAAHARDTDAPTAPLPAADAPTEVLPAAPPEGGAAAKKAPAKKAAAEKTATKSTAKAPSAKKTPAPDAGTATATTQPEEAAPPPQAVPLETGPPAKQRAPAPARHAAPAEVEVEPIDLLESAGPALAKRLAPALGVVALLIVLRRLRRR